MSNHTTADTLSDGLPQWMADGKSSNIYKLLKVFSKRLDEVDQDIKDIDTASTVQTAETAAQLDQLNALSDATMAGCSCLDDYRAKIIASYQNLTAQGTPNHLLRNAAYILDIPVENITYSDGTENGSAELKLESADLTNLDMTTSAFADLMKDQMAASYRLDIITEGSFLMTTEDELAAGIYDPATGFDTLDTNGDPTGYGGVYSKAL